jgi:hypothetical protein
MHILVVSLLTILAGTLLLAKTKKEALGKFFTYVSWFFVGVGCLLFIASICFGICRMRHGCNMGQGGCRQEMMMRNHQGMLPGSCCSPDKFQGGKANCMSHDSMMKHGSMKSSMDTVKMAAPKTK